jgi:hypothetical protein
MKFAGSVTIVDNEGNTVHERELSADEMIGELLAHKSPTPGATYTHLFDPGPPIGQVTKLEEKNGGLEITIKPDRDAFRKGIKKAAKNSGGGDSKGKKKPACSRCGREGHNAKTCGRDLEPASTSSGKDEKRDADVRLRIKRMVDGGLDSESIKGAIRRADFPPKEYPDRELEELIAWAQK